ncbi:carboxypeptidase-like regulatory domain-containing protein [Methanocella arvoryzae]|nr:carboxypeptidase-like regulatory domain-containing protein [Methanocella arvoryzae]
MAQLGTITGVITTGNRQAVPDALVTLYDMDGDYVFVPDNPQFSSNGTGNNVGVYTFTDVPSGTYNVTAIKGDSEFFAIARLESGTATANIVLADYYVTPEDFMPPPAVREPELERPRQYFSFVPATFGKMPPATAAVTYPFSRAVATSTAYALLLAGSR